MDLAAVKEAHPDDSYGSCVTCREYIWHTDDETRLVAYPCPAIRLAEMEATFELRWKADMRAIALWQEAHPDKKDIWPDHADLVVWLMEDR